VCTCRLTRTRTQSNDGIYPLAFLENWRKSYRSRENTASLDDSKTAGMEVFARLVVSKETEWEKKLMTGVRPSAISIVSTVAG
jgi:hypothetical protein